ncbi:MAG: hypothetical protein AAF902_22825 [Chloroflexota bacterium]
MTNQLSTATYIQTGRKNKQRTHAVSANLTTSTGLEFYIAAVSEKKAGDFASGDTPRMALFSFLTGLQTGQEDTIQQIILGGVVQAAQAVHDFREKRDGAPCSLAAAIVNDGQLYTLKIGPGSILTYKGLTTRQIIKTTSVEATGFWLGDGVVTDTFSLAQIVQNQLDKKMSVLVCQQELGDLIQTHDTEFVRFFEQISAKHQSHSIPVELSNWAKSYDSDMSSTHALIHAKDNSFIDFFTLNEALLGVEDEDEPLDSARFVDLTGLSNIDEDQENQDQEDEEPEVLLKPPDTKSESVETPLVEFSTPDQPFAGDPMATLISNGLSLKDYLDEKLEDGLSETTYTQPDEGDETEAGPSADGDSKLGDMDLPEKETVGASALETIVAPALQLGANVFGEDDSGYVLFSSADTMQSFKVDALPGAPIMPPVPPISEEVTRQIPTINKENLDVTRPIKTLDLTADRDLQDGSSVWDSQQSRMLFLENLSRFLIPTAVALFGLVILLFIGSFFVRNRSDVDSQDDAMVALGPDGPGNDGQSGSGDDCELPNPELCNTSVVVVPPTNTPTPTPTATDEPTPTTTATQTETPTPVPPTSTPTETPVLPVAQLLKAAENSSDLLFLEDFVVSSNLARIVFSDVVIENEPIDEVYALPGSVLAFSENLAEQSFEIEQGSLLVVNSQINPIKIVLPAVGLNMEILNGVMGINYAGANQPVIVSCYTGNCGWLSGAGLSSQLEPGRRIALDATNTSSENTDIPTRVILGAETLQFYRELNADPAGRIVAQQVLARYLPPPPTATPLPPTVTPTPQPQSSGGANNSGSGSNNPAPTSTPVPPTPVPAPATATLEPLPERPTASAPQPEPTEALPTRTSPTTEADPTGFPPTSTPQP